MIYIGKVADMSDSFDENLMIVRSPDEIPPFAKHIPLLSPSPELFACYKNALKQGLFIKQWFDQKYVPRFISELSENIEAMAYLEKLCEISRHKDIFLACYCAVEALCHRSIIAGILLGMGAQIKTDDSYIKYFELLSIEQYRS